MSLDALLAQLKSMIPSEVYDGVDLDSVVDMVDLDIECSPVVIEPAPHFEHTCPNPATAEKQVTEKYGERYCLYQGKEDFRYATPDEVKRMRGRYLLLRTAYLKRLPSLPYSFQQEVISKFFPGGVYRPAFLDTTP